MHWRFSHLIRFAALGAALALPGPATAAYLSLEIRLSRDPQAVAFCTLQLDQSLVSLTESRGSTAPAASTLRWPATPDEAQALLAAFGALLANDLPQSDGFSARWPRPPFISVTWEAPMTDGLAAGAWYQSGLTLPPVLQTVVMTCGAALAGQR